MKRRLCSMLLMLALLAGMLTVPAAAFAVDWAVPDDGVAVPADALAVTATDRQNTKSSIVHSGGYCSLYLENITDTVAGLQEGDILYYRYSTNETDCYALLTVTYIDVSDTSATIRGTDYALTGQIGSGSFGTKNTLKWELAADGTLTISGMGEMPNYYAEYVAPWGTMFGSIQKIVIEDGITAIGDYAFADCSALTSVTIPTSVTKIGKYAFAYCKDLTQIDGADGVTSIQERAFMDCASLPSISFPALITLEEAVFLRCESLGELNLAEGLTEIGGGAFYDCDTLQQVTIPASVTAIGSWAFSCSSLQRIYFQGDAPSMEEKIFSGVVGLAFYPAGASGWTNDIMQDYGGSVNWMRLDATGDPVVETVASGNCGTGLTWALNSMGVLTISGVGEMDNWTGGSNNILNDNAAEEWPGWHENRTRIWSVVVENGVTSIGDYAFDNCHYLTSITLPSTLTSIGKASFTYCSRIQSINLPDSVVSIGGYAFYCCSRLTTISIPSGVTKIGGYTFFGCSSLASLTIPSSVVILGSGAFQSCTSLTSITIPGTVKTIGGSAFEDCTALSEVTITSGVQKIETCAFLDCDSLESLTIPASVSSIGGYAFGYQEPQHNSYIPVDGFTVIGYTGSTASSYASRNGLNFVSLGTASSGSSSSGSSSSSAGSASSSASSSTGSSSSSSGSVSRYTDITSGSYYDS